ncbi:hypothetical protein CDIK_0556 [Cucumispora dikerogammari]|nr:hypothetical protein CDIK_0556 [Cucumispora dikerogammari]
MSGNNEQKQSNDKEAETIDEVIINDVAFNSKHEKQKPGTKCKVCNKKRSNKNLKKTINEAKSHLEVKTPPKTVQKTIQISSKITLIPHDSNETAEVQKILFEKKKPFYTPTTVKILSKNVKDETKTPALLSKTLFSEETKEKTKTTDNTEKRENTVTPKKVVITQVDPTPLIESSRTKKIVLNSSSYAFDNSYVPVESNKIAGIKEIKKEVLSNKQLLNNRSGVVGEEMPKNRISKTSIKVDSLSEKDIINEPSYQTIDSGQLFFNKEEHDKLIGRVVLNNRSSLQKSEIGTVDNSRVSPVTEHNKHLTNKQPDMVNVAEELLQADDVSSISKPLQDKIISEEQLTILKEKSFNNLSIKKEQDLHQEIKKSITPTEIHNTTFSPTVFIKKTGGSVSVEHIILPSDNLIMQNVKQDKSTHTKENLLVSSKELLKSIVDRIYVNETRINEKESALSLIKEEQMGKGECKLKAYSSCLKPARVTDEKFLDKNSNPNVVFNHVFLASKSHTKLCEDEYKKVGMNINIKNNQQQETINFPTDTLDRKVCNDEKKHIIQASPTSIPLVLGSEKSGSLEKITLKTVNRSSGSTYFNDIILPRVKKTEEDVILESNSPLRVIKEESMKQLLETKNSDYLKRKEINTDNVKIFYKSSIDGQTENKNLIKNEGQQNLKDHECSYNNQVGDNNRIERLIVTEHNPSAYINTSSSSVKNSSSINNINNKTLENISVTSLKNISVASLENLSSSSATNTANVNFHLDDVDKLKSVAPLPVICGTGSDNTKSTFDSTQLNYTDIAKPDIGSTELIDYKDIGRSVLDISEKLEIIENNIDKVMKYKDKNASNSTQKEKSIEDLSKSRIDLKDLRKKCSRLDHLIKTIRDEKIIYNKNKPDKERIYEKDLIADDLVSIPIHQEITPTETVLKNLDMQHKEEENALENEDKNKNHVPGMRTFEDLVNDLTSPLTNIKKASLVIPQKVIVEREDQVKNLGDLENAAQVKEAINLSNKKLDNLNLLNELACFKNNNNDTSLVTDNLDDLNKLIDNKLQETKKDTLKVPTLHLGPANATVPKTRILVVGPEDLSKPVEGAQHQHKAVPSIPIGLNNLNVEIKKGTLGYEHKEDEKKSIRKNRSKKAVEKETDGTFSRISRSISAMFTSEKKVPTKKIAKSKGTKPSKWTEHESYLELQKNKGKVKELIEYFEEIDKNSKKETYDNDHGTEKNNKK